VASDAKGDKVTWIIVVRVLVNVVNIHPANILTANLTPMTVSLKHSSTVAVKVTFTRSLVPDSPMFLAKAFRMRAYRGIALLALSRSSSFTTTLTLRLDTV
jgi:hypothetical protein